MHKIAYYVTIALRMDRFIIIATNQNPYFMATQIICFLALNFNQAMSALGLSAEDMSDEIPAEMLEQVADDESDDFALDEEQ